MAVVTAEEEEELVGGLSSLSGPSEEDVEDDDEDTPQSLEVGRRVPSPMCVVVEVLLLRRREAGVAVVVGSVAPRSQTV